MLKLVATLDDGVPKEKRFVVVAIADNALLCVMNSEIHPLIQNNAASLRCQVRLESTLPFVDRECHLDCSRLRSFSPAEVTQQLMEDLTRHLGDVPEDVRDEIRAAIQQAPTLSLSDVSLVVAALDEIVF